MSHKDIPPLAEIPILLEDESPNPAYPLAGYYYHLIDDLKLAPNVARKYVAGDCWSTRAKKRGVTATSVRLTLTGKPGGLSYKTTRSVEEFIHTGDEPCNCGKRLGIDQPEAAKEEPEEVEVDLGDGDGDDAPKESVFKLPPIPEREPIEPEPGFTLPENRSLWWLFFTSKHVLWLLGIVFVSLFFFGLFMFLTWVFVPVPLTGFVVGGIAAGIANFFYLIIVYVRVRRAIPILWHFVRNEEFGHILLQRRLRNLRILPQKFRKFVDDQPSAVVVEHLQDEFYPLTIHPTTPQEVLNLDANDDEEWNFKARATRFLSPVRFKRFSRRGSPRLRLKLSGISTPNFFKTKEDAVFTGLSIAVFVGAVAVFVFAGGSGSTPPPVTTEEVTTWASFLRIL